jgi:hypothetical protein
MGAQSVPPKNSLASGTGSFTLTDAGLVFNTTVDGLEIANAHFHNAAIGENGGVVRGILNEFTNNTASGVWTGNDAQALTNELASELILGNIYLNIHTADNPGGEIRGQLSPFEIVTSLEEIKEEGNSNEFALYQNVPNPFIDRTEIQFQLNKAGHTELKILDIVGNKIADLVNEKLAAGKYKLSFDSSQLASGIYICQLNFNGIRKTSKMILSK